MAGPSRMKRKNNTDEDLRNFSDGLLVDTLDSHVEARSATRLLRLIPSNNH